MEIFGRFRYMQLQINGCLFHLDIGISQSYHRIQVGEGNCEPDRKIVKKIGRFISDLGIDKSGCNMSPQEGEKESKILMGLGFLIKYRALPS